MSPLWPGLVGGWRGLWSVGRTRASPRPRAHRRLTATRETAGQPLGDAPRTAMCSWRPRYGVKRSQMAPRQIWQPVPLERLVAQQALQGRAPMGPETNPVLRHPLRRIWRRATRRMRQVWWGRWLENSLYLKGVEGRRLGLSTHQLSRARPQLQRLGLLSLMAAARPCQESPRWGTRGEWRDPSGPLKDFRAGVGRGGTDHSPHFG
jgi:hypothetical protein